MKRDQRRLLFERLELRCMLDGVGQQWPDPSGGDPDDPGLLQTPESELPTLSIADAWDSEGNPGDEVYFEFTVTLSQPSEQLVRVYYTTSPGTATADEDYDPISGWLEFQPGEIQKTIRVQIFGDLMHEPDETFFVILSDAEGAIVERGVATGTILTDDPIPRVSINDIQLPEGHIGSTAFEFTVSLSNPSYQAVTVSYHTADGTATVAGYDYEAASGTLVFEPGQTEKTITILVFGDWTAEPDETFSVVLTDPQGAELAPGDSAVGVATILNDDFGPTLSISDIAVEEGDSGTTEFVFTITLSEASDQPVEVTYATSDGTAMAADNDYEPVVSTVVFEPGQTQRQIVVVVYGDVKYEPDETFYVTLSYPVGASLDKSVALATIRNDDQMPVINIADVTMTEGDEGEQYFSFTVWLSAPSYQTVSVSYATQDGTATVADGDYQSAAWVLDFVPGTTTNVITIRVYGDRKYEPDEWFFVTLSEPEGAVLNPDKSAGVGTIRNDDPLPKIYIDDVSQAEGHSGSSAMVFTVELSNPSYQTVTVSFLTNDATATVADGDYEPAGGTLVFEPGQTEKTITVWVYGDQKVELDETFYVILSDPEGATLEKYVGMGVILNDDLLGRISGMVYADFDASGQPGPGEGLPGVLLSLYDAQGNLVQQTWSDQDGWYEFADLAAGTYRVVQRQPAAMIDGGPNEFTVDTAGQLAATNVHFREIGLRPEYVYLRLLSTTSMPIGSEKWTQAIGNVLASAEQDAGNQPVAPPQVSQQVVQQERLVRVRGSSGADDLVLTIGGAEHVLNINGQEYRFSAAAVDALMIDGGTGADKIRIVGSAGNERVSLWPKGGWLQTAALRVSLAGLEQIELDGGEGYDEADLLDSFADDQLFAASDFAQLYGYFFGQDVSKFNRVVARSVSGGSDRLLRFDPLDYVLQTEGDWRPY